MKMEHDTSKLKPLLILVFAVAFQATSAQNIELGLKSGINFARLSYPNTNNQFIVGFNAGAFAQFKVKKITLQPEILYSQQGNSVHFTLYSPGGGPYSANLKSIFNYLNIPIIVKYKLGKVFNVQAGPQLGFVLVAKEQSTFSSSYQDVKNTNSDFSMVLGVGAEFLPGITIDSRYNAGLTNVASTGSAKNQVIQLSVGYRFVKLK